MVFNPWLRRTATWVHVRSLDIRRTNFAGHLLYVVAFERVAACSGVHVVLI